MTCTRIDVPGGGVAIVCTHGGKSRKAPRCSVVWPAVSTNCTANATLECDGCDAPICRIHTLSPRRDLDFCPACTTPLKRWWLENDGRQYSGQPKSALLMHFVTWARGHLDRFPRSATSKRLESVP
jgi:hypothetical protein